MKTKTKYEPDDNIRVFARSNDWVGRSLKDRPKAEEIERMIAGYKAVAPPTGFKKIHETTATGTHIIWSVRVTAVYERIKKIKT